MDTPISVIELFTIFNVVRVFAVAALAFFLNLILTHIWTKVLYTYFRPGKEIEKAGAPIYSALHKKKEGTPTMGGLPIWVTVAFLTIYFSFLASAVDGFWSRVNFLSRGQTLLPLGFLMIAGLVGMADDVLGIFRRKGFSLWGRLFMFSTIAAVGAWWFVVKLGFDTVNVPFYGDVVIGPIWYGLLFLFVMVASSFSADITDGLDGLVGGIFLTIFAALGAIAFDQGKMELVTFIAAIEGALIAFLWFNIYPAKFFMGDTGVMPLGMLVGVIAMLTNVTLLLPIIAIIFLMEALSDIIQWISKGIRKKKFFLSAPIHHHFEALGWPETQITMRFWMMNAIGALIGLIIFLVDSKLPPLG